jgi:phage gp36-like protein
MPEFFKLQGGATEQFTLVTSVQCDSGTTPHLSIFDSSGTLVNSGPATTSGDFANGHFYRFVPLPDTPGFFTWEWLYAVTANTFVGRREFEIIHSRALETAGLYANANDVRNAYEPLNQAKFANAEIDEVIVDIQNEINAKLCHRYDVPFDAPPPPMIETVTKYLSLHRIVGQKLTAGTPEWIGELAETYRGYLDEVAAGSSFLINSAGDVVSESMAAVAGQAEHNLENYVPTFNTLDPEDQRIDPDLEDAENDAL